MEWWKAIQSLNQVREGLSSIVKVVHPIPSHNAVFLRITVVQAGVLWGEKWGRKKRGVQIISKHQTGISWVSQMDTGCWRRCKGTVKEGRGTCSGGEWEPVEKAQGTNLGVSAQSTGPSFKPPLCASGYSTISSFCRGEGEWQRKV